MSDSEKECWSHVDNFPLHTKIDCLNMRPNKKTSEKNKSSPRVFTRGSTKKKQADDFFIEFGSELATLKESFLTTTECMNDVIENYNKIYDRIVKLAHVVAEIGERIVLFSQRMNELSQRMIELE